MRRVSRSRLGSPTFIAEGGAGKVYRVAAKIAGLPSPVAYKEIRIDVSAEMQKATLEAMTKVVAMRDSMSAADLTALDEVTTWPLALVEDHGRDIGCLLPLLDMDYSIHLRQVGRPPQEKVFELGMLCASENWFRQMGVNKPSADDGIVRLALMARLAYAIELLHRYGLVFGDLSLKNVAIATDLPWMLLMDCDGVAELSDKGRVQLHSPFFFPPENVSKQQTLQDHETDVFKLGLCIVRGLARGQGVTQLTDPADAKVIAGLLDQTGIGLLKRAVGTDRVQRPSAKDLKEYLVDRVLSLVQPPELLSASLNCRLLLRGSEAIVSWSQRNATALRLIGLNGFEVTLDPNAHPHGYAFRPKSSGPILVEVSNQHGSDQLEAGFIDYCELPPFDIEKQLRGLLPRLSVPDLEPVQIPDALAALPPRPMVSTEAHPVPRIDLPAFGRDLAPLLTGAAPGPLNATAVRDAANHAIDDAARQIGIAMTEGVQTLRGEIDERIRALVAGLNDRER